MTEEIKRFLDPSGGAGEDDTSLRPLSLGEFVGQEKLKEKLSIFIQIYKLYNGFFLFCHKLPRNYVSMMI